MCGTLQLAAIRSLGGLTAQNLVKNSRGKIVSKKASAHAKKHRYANIKGWIEEHSWPRMVDFDPRSQMQSRKIYQGRWDTTMVMFDKVDGGSTEGFHNACRNMGTREYAVK